MKAIEKTTFLCADPTEQQKNFMRRAIRLSCENIKSGGGPFGAVIVKNGEVIASGTNRVVPSGDPTAHAEITAIRRAARELGTHDLTGCEIYTSCEPCPMCLGAIYWARIGKIFCGNTKADATNAGFDDSFIYTELASDPSCRKIPSYPVLPEEAAKAFREWEKAEDKREY